MDKLNNLPKLNNNPPRQENKMSGPRNKNAGYVFENEVKELVIALGFPHAVLARVESVARDRDKVDIMNKAEFKHGRIPYNFQCKNISSGTKLNYQQILDVMPKGDEINIVLHNHTVKQHTKTKGQVRFVTKGQYAITNMADMFKLLQQIQNLEKAYKILHDYFDSIPEQDKAKVAQQLEALGL